MDLRDDHSDRNSDRNANDTANEELQAGTRGREDASYRGGYRPNGGQPKRKFRGRRRFGGSRAA